MRYHHIGIPTEEIRDGERHLPHLGMYVSGWEESPFGVEWMRFESDSPLPELVQTVSHVAFEVDDLEAALQGHEVLIQPNSPSEGILVAFIVHDGAPVEFIEVRDEGGSDVATKVRDRGGADDADDEPPTRSARRGGSRGRAR